MSTEVQIALVSLLSKACESVENQANWDKPPYSTWYYEAKKVLKSEDITSFLIEVSKRCL